MAAHGLTILLQVERMIETAPERAMEYAYGATSATGTCPSAGFDSDTWTELDRASAPATGSLEALSDAVGEGIARHMWMDAYRCLEDIRAAFPNGDWPTSRPRYA